MNVLLVRKKSAYELYANESGEQAAKYIEQKEHNVEELEDSYKRQMHSLHIIESTLREHNQEYTFASRAKAPEVIKGGNFDLIICLGGDGTFLEISHFVKNEIMWGINADPECSVGFFTGTLAETFPDDWLTFKGLPRSTIPRGRVCINDNCFSEQFVNNALFAGKNPMQTARFTIEQNGELQSHIRNSGLLVCAAGGSTAWMHQVGGVVMDISDNRFQYIIREVKDEKPLFA